MNSSVLQVEETTNTLSTYMSSMEEKLQRINSRRNVPAQPYNTLPFQVKYFVKELIKHEVGSVCKVDSKFATAHDHTVANYWLFRHGIRKTFTTSRKNMEWGMTTLIIRSTYKLSNSELSKAYKNTIVRDVLDLEQSDLYSNKIPLKFRYKLPDELLELQKNITLVNNYISTNNIESDRENIEVPPESTVVEPEVQSEPVVESNPVIEETQVNSINSSFVINFQHIVHKDIYTTIHTLNSMNLLTSDLIQSLNDKIKEQIIDTNLVQAILDNGK